MIFISIINRLSIMHKTSYKIFVLFQNSQKMSTTVEDAKNTKQKYSKTDRKVNRAVNKISKDVGLIFSKEPTNALIICNSGHVTGASYESLAELFSPYGDLENIYIVPGKSFCFIKYHTVDDTIKAYEDCNGNKSLKEVKIPIYMAYVSNIPEKFQKDPLTIINELPKGLKIIEEFITPDEEIDLLKSFNWEEKTILKNRQVRHFGKEFVYGSNMIAENDSKIKPFPETWTTLIQRSINQEYQQRWPDQCTVNRYLPGQGIPPHVDNHNCCDDTILSLSLGSDVIMNFVRLDDPDRKTITINLPPRSLMIMSDEARYIYTHGIVPRNSDIINSNRNNQHILTLRNRGERVSLTFRKSLSVPNCTCPFPLHCPAQEKNSSLVDKLDNSTAIQLEKLHVHTVYEEIAGHFSETRYKPWPKVMNFLDAKLSQPGAILVDVGCGNGKYLGHHKNAFQLGLDYSRNLLTFVQQKNQEALRSDILSIPFRDGVADACISIAVIHHLSTKERRIRAVQEIFRILKIGGSALLYAWAKDQEINCQPSTYLNSKTETDQQTAVMTQCKITLPVHANRTNFKHNDLLVPWKRQTDSFHRFYHVFEHGELEMLLNQALRPERFKIEELYYDQGNWCVSFSKKAELNK